jgi:hypothetical protein
MTKAVKQAFTSFGISAEDPLEMQKDFAFIRTLRVGSASLKTHGLVTLIGILVTAATTLIWLGVKSIWSAR